MRRFFGRFGRRKRVAKLRATFNGLASNIQPILGEFDRGRQVVLYERADFMTGQSIALMRLKRDIEAELRRGAGADAETLLEATVLLRNRLRRALGLPLEEMPEL